MTFLIIQGKSLGPDSIGYIEAIPIRSAGYSILILLFISGAKLQTNNKPKPASQMPFVQGYICDMYSNDVLRVKNDKSLIYVNVFIEGIFS